MPVRQPSRSARSPWRYAFILVVVCLAVVVAAAAGWRFARTSSSPSNGPVVLLAVDGLRADRLRVYGYNAGRTPAIDRLAQDAVVFERAYAHSPLVLPSHVSILSGQLPFETGVRDDEGSRVRAGTTLLPQLLKVAGYRTAAAVSSRSLGPDAGLAGAFDFFDAGIDAGGRHTVRTGDKTVAAARKWADGAGTARFFLFVQLADVSDSSDVIGPPTSEPQATYDERVSKADGFVAQVVKWLNGRGLYDRATIILLAAHGEGLGTHGEQGHGLLLHDDTLRVPFIIKLPRDVSRGRRIAAPVQHIDVLPTLLDLLDAPRPPSATGRSLRSLVIGKGAPVREQAVYSETLLGRRLFGWAGLQSLTDDHYRYVRAPREELYDLRDDPGEQRNIAADQPAVVEKMRTALAQAVASNAQDIEPAGPDPKDKVAAYEQYLSAIALTSRGQLQEAAAAWREFLAMEPASVNGWLQLANVWQHAGRFGDAADAFARVPGDDPRHADATLSLAYSLLKAGRLTEARTRVERAVALAPARAHELLARVAVERGDWIEATRQAEQAQKADASTAAEAYVGGMRLYRSGHYEQALPLLEQVTRSVTEDTARVLDAGSSLADTLGRLERYAEAETAWKAEVARSPYSVQPRISLAMLYHAQRRDADVEAAIVELVREVQTPEAYNAAARLWTIRGEKDRADAMRADARSRFGQDAVLKPRTR